MTQEMTLKSSAGVHRVPAPGFAVPYTPTAPRTAPSSNATGTVPFPDGFLWGAATAAYQVEGAAHEDGREDSVWDAFAKVPGAVLNQEDGEVACDLGRLALRLGMKPQAEDLFRRFLARYPDKRLPIIMLTNRNDNFLGPTVDRIADVILGAP